MHILSFDIEEWFLSRDDEKFPVQQWDSFDSRVEKNIRVILELLEKHGQKATFFILGWVAEKYPQLIRQIDRAGHEIGYHSYDHKHLINQIANKKFEQDIEKGLELIEGLTGKKVRSYRAPYFSFNSHAKTVVEVLLKHGIQTDSSIKSYSGTQEYFKTNMPFFFESGGEKLLELPLPRINWPIIKPVFSGSGYFRILPSNVLHYLFKKNNYVMAYFHPRDFDASAPFSNRLSFSRNLLNRVGVGKTTDKLDAILSAFEFKTVGETFDILSSSEAKISTFNLGHS